MGTDCVLAAVVPRCERACTEEVLRRAEAAIRGIEACMSTWLDDSELGRLNAAAAGEEVPLSPQSLAVLQIAQEAHRQTCGTFDVTCRPLVELWRRAGKRGLAPTESEIAEARAASNWGLVEWTDGGAVKRSATARVDLGGIAKGYAIDRAADVLREAGCRGGLVDVGGDLACFGKPADGETWPVDVKDPSGPGHLARVRLLGGAVCTSGSYARFTEIAGRRYSHIIDPRTGRPADAVLSATTVAPTAVVADVWATALSVLGAEGLVLLPEGVEAMVVQRAGNDSRILCTPGFRELLEEPLTE
ncbi:MAG: hypothetical protein A2V70_09155 [Planctomycetes bacterium RBG_13_63_9]|nr:MAG: hypothetical protein A2V70_09155 [Planctomycetes bacterium RBG_13_63_9]